MTNVCPPQYRLMPDVYPNHRPATQEEYEIMRPWLRWHYVNGTIPIIRRHNGEIAAPAKGETGASGVFLVRPLGFRAAHELHGLNPDGSCIIHVWVWVSPEQVKHWNRKVRAAKIQPPETVEEAHRLAQEAYDATDHPA